MPGGLCRPQLRQRTGERDVSPWESPLTASDDGWPDYGVLFTHTQFTSHWATGSGRADMHIHSLSRARAVTHTHTDTPTHKPICMLLCVHMYTCMRPPECIDKKGGGNNKRKGANSLLQPCHVRSIWQINPLLRRRWRSPTFQSRPLSFQDAWWHVKSDFQQCMLLWHGVYSGVSKQQRLNTTVSAN